MTLTRPQGVVVASVLVLTSGAAYLALLQAEGRNPRRRLLEQSWGQVPIGVSEVTAFRAMGLPDESRKQGDEDCAREHFWYEWAREQTGRVFVVCADQGGVIRSKQVGMAFNLRSW